MGYTHGVSINSKNRTCTKCNKEFPNTNEYFSYADKRTGILNAVCKTCQSILNRERREQIIEQNKEKDLFYDGTRRCKKCQRDLPNNKLYFPIDLACIDGLRTVCRECSKKGAGFLDPNYIPPQKWSKEEDDLIIKNYHDYTGKELHEKFFPNRSIRAIETHADLLGIAWKTEETYKRSREFQAKIVAKKLKGCDFGQEWRDKISATKKEYYKTHDGWWKGRKRSPEQCKAISERMKGKWSGDKNPRHINPLNGELNGRWKGGILSTYQELRSDTKDWFKESMDFCGYKCVITGGEFDNVHHTTAFREIVDQIFKITGINVKQQVCDYTNEELQTLRDELKELHRIYGYGACINKEIHKLFHDNYGYTKFSPFDFLDFIYRIDIGEFDKWFAKNNLKIKINYDYVNYLESTLNAIAESA